MYSLVLLILAVLPVAALAFYVYKKDKNKEPFGLLFKIFMLGFLSAFPVIIVEKLLGTFFNTNSATTFITMFICVFFGVALVEEGFKWLVTKFFGYNDKNFDEIYDIIVYSVYASLGFACIENILYVLGTGATSVAIKRAIFSIPGHTCFAIAMGCFLAKAKVGSINNNKSIYNKNMYFSMLIPTLIHAFYDTFLLYPAAVVDSRPMFAMISVILFFVFDIATVVICFIQVHKVSKIQDNVSTNVAVGNIVSDKSNHIHANIGKVDSDKIRFCPVCGSNVEGKNFCGRCGFKLR